MCRILLKSKLSAKPILVLQLSPPVVFVGYRETVASSNETMQSIITSRTFGILLLMW